MSDNLLNNQKIIAKERFLEIQKLFKRLSDEMGHVIESYYIWETLVYSRSIVEVGKKEAEKNTAIMTQYKDFFITTEHNHMDSFIIGISKFFDCDQRALSIQQLIKKIKESQEIITADILMEIYPNRFYEEELKNGYKPLHEEDLKYIKGLRKKHKSLISTLKTIRDKQSAHTDIEVIKMSFIPKEVVELIEAVQQMLNKLSSRFDSATTTWDQLKNDSISDTKLLLENLERGEIRRKEEIKKAISQLN